MATLTTRASKGSPLTNTELDSDLNLLNADIKPKTATIANPVVGDKVLLFYSPSPSPAANLTLSKIQSTRVGGTGLTFNVKYGSDPSAAGTAVTSSAMSAATGAGTATTTFSSATIPAGNWCWLEVASVTGTVTLFAASLLF